MAYMNAFKIPENPELQENLKIPAGSYMVICPASINGFTSPDGTKHVPALIPFASATPQLDDTVNDAVSVTWAYMLAHELTHFILKTRGENFMKSINLELTVLPRLWLRMG
jgi:hypothetical protein